MSKLGEYLNQNINNPKYLFHGSPLLLEKIVPMQSHDSYNKKNEDKAVFLTSCLQTAAAYVFRGKLKEINDKGYNFHMNNNGESPFMYFAVDNFSEDLAGYIYVFNITDDMIKDKEKGNLQYRCYHSLVPDDIMEIKYKDFEQYFKNLSSDDFEKKIPKKR